MFLKIADISVISLAHQTKIISQDHLASSKPVEQIELLARVRALSLLPFFFFIPPDDLMLLAQTTAVRKVSKNAEIFKKGDDAQSMFVVLEGSFQVILDDDGKQLTVANIWPGEYFGEMSLFTGAPRSATIVAQNDSTVIEIGKKTVEGLFNSHPSFANTIANIIEERMAINSKKITEENNAVQSTAKTSIGLLTSIKSFFNL